MFADLINALRLCLGVCAGMLIFNGPAYAEDTVPQTQTVTAPAPVALPYSYAPPGCDFRMELPSAPMQGKRCDPDDASRCSAVTTYTHVFGIDASINFTMTCNPPEPNMYDRYNGDVMRATLDGMVGKGKLDSYQTGFKQYDAAKEATLIGTGKEGVSDKIYIAELWIGHQSVFSIEAEMIGDDSAAADDMFAAILKSVRYKDWKLTPTGAAVTPPAAAAPATASNPPPAAAAPSAAPASAVASLPATAPPAAPPGAPVPTDAADTPTSIPAIKMDANALPAGTAAPPPGFAPPSQTLIVTPEQPATEQGQTQGVPQP